MTSSTIPDESFTSNALALAQYSMFTFVWLGQFHQDKLPSCLKLKKIARQTKVMYLLSS